MTFSRTRGDTHPIKAIIKVDGVAIDLTGSIVTFSYKNETQTVKSITGSTTGTIGEVSFAPTAGVDFIVEGVYSFDIQRVANSITSTHLKGIMILDGDVTV